MRRRRLKSARVLLVAGILLLFCLCGCGKDFSSDYAALEKALSAGSGRTEAKFQAETTFRDLSGTTGSVLYSISGNLTCDREKKEAEQEYTATLLAKPVRAKDVFRDGKQFHTEDGETVSSDANFEEILRSYPFHAPVLPDLKEILSLTVSGNRSGTLYTLETSGSKEKLDELCGWDWYEMTGISSPDKTKESFGNLVLTYTVAEGKIRSFSAECAFRIYRTAGYTPGRADAEGDGLELNVRLQWSFDGN